MSWRPIHQGGDWLAIGSDRMSDRLQFFKRLTGVDASFSGTVNSGRGFFTEKVIIGATEEGARLEWDPQSFANTVWFYHENDTDPDYNCDNPGIIWSYCTPTGQGMTMAPPYNDDIKRPEFGIAVYTAGGGGAWLHDEGWTTDTHLDYVLNITARETDTKALSVTNNATSDFTEPLVEVDISGQDGVWLDCIDGTSYHAVMIEQDGGTGGLLVDQGGGFLPAGDFEEPTDETGGITSWTDVGSGLTFTYGTSATYPVRVLASGQVVGYEASTGSATFNTRIGISFDNGSTWDYGNGTQDRIDNATILRATAGPHHGRKGTPTGNIKVRMEVQSSSSNTDFINMHLQAQVFGDI